MTPPIEVDEVATPHVPSSSPCLDAMDISPLPHKMSHFVAQVTLPSPTPETTPVLEIIPDLLSPEDQPVADQPLSLAPPPPFFQSQAYVIDQALAGCPY
jgi:M-phase inducer tyrosine phosphatase